MLTVMIIVSMVMVLFGGAVLAFSVTPDDDQQPMQAEAEKVAAEALQQAPALVFFQPTGWSMKSKQASVEEIVASIEEHLRKERQAAAQFARDPSARTLWVD